MRLIFRVIAIAVLVSTCCSCFAITVSAPTKLIPRGSNIIVWQDFGAWLLVTEDQKSGRICYYYNYLHKSKMTLKKPAPGSWVPLGSAIKWLMYTDYVDGLNRLMAHDVDWHKTHIAWASMTDQIGCAFSGSDCFYAQYRPYMIDDHYPVDIYRINLQTGLSVPFWASDTEKSQFAHDGVTLVYRAHYGIFDDRICGIRLSGSEEFEITDRDGLYPAVAGNIVAWAEKNGSGWDITAIDINTGDMRKVAYTAAQQPRPQVGFGKVYWQDSRTAKTTGLDIYGYDWASQKEFVVTKSRADQYGLRVCGNMVTWVAGSGSNQTLWGSKVK